MHDRRVEQKVRLKQMLSSAAKYILCPKLFLISYLLAVSVPSITDGAKKNYQNHATAYYQTFIWVKMIVLLEESSMTD